MSSNKAKTSPYDVFIMLAAFVFLDFIVAIFFLGSAYPLYMGHEQINAIVLKPSASCYYHRTRTCSVAISYQYKDEWHKDINLYVPNDYADRLNRYILRPNLDLLNRKILIDPDDPDDPDDLEYCKSDLRWGIILSIPILIYFLALLFVYIKLNFFNRLRSSKTVHAERFRENIP